MPLDEIMVNAATIAALEVLTYDLRGIALPLPGEEPVNTAGSGKGYQFRAAQAEGPVTFDESKSV